MNNPLRYVNSVRTLFQYLYYNTVQNELILPRGVNSKIFFLLKSIHYLMMHFPIIHAGFCCFHKKKRDPGNEVSFSFYEANHLLKMEMT